MRWRIFQSPPYKAERDTIWIWERENPNGTPLRTKLKLLTFQAWISKPKSKIRTRNLPTLTINILELRNIRIVPYHQDKFKAKTKKRVKQIKTDGVQ